MNTNLNQAEFNADVIEAGRITIPAKHRKKLGIKTGAVVRVIVYKVAEAALQ